MPWVPISKPTGTGYTNVAKPTGTPYTNVAKPTTPGKSIRKGMTTARLIPLTYAKDYGTVGSNWVNIAKPTT